MLVPFPAHAILSAAGLQFMCHCLSLSSVIQPWQLWQLLTPSHVNGLHSMQHCISANSQ